MIRAATPEDMPRIWLLIQELAHFEKLPVTGTLTDLKNDVNRAFWGFVYELEGELVAYAIIYPTYSTFRTKSSMWLEDLYVTPEHRAHGIGKEMLEFLIDEVKRLEYCRLEWSVLDWNQRAVDFYLDMGAELFPDWRLCRVTF